MIKMKKIGAVITLAAAASFGLVLGVVTPAAAAPVGSCTSSPYWDNSLVAGVASCNGSYWRLNVGCLNNSTVYGAWGGPRTAVTRHSGCKDNWFVSAWTE
ncbi:MAG TPA: hypothetical protein VFU07_06840 [Candidatus Lumbricidophila sp.]|nr:hypothetical protein [Candidatus Lumbricidophila sp.]